MTIDNLDQHNQHTFVFQTTSQYNVEISIDDNKALKELIKSYFKKINRLDLYKDKNIRFIFKGDVIPHNSKNRIKTLLNELEDGNIILVDDVEERIKEA